MPITPHRVVLTPPVNPPVVKGKAPYGGFPRGVMVPLHQHHVAVKPASIVLMVLLAPAEAEVA